MPYILRHDVKSHVSRSTTYGREYDPVAIVSTSHNVLIVEGESGRFPACLMDVIEVTDKQLASIRRDVIRLRELESLPQTPLTLKKITAQRTRIESTLQVSANYLIQQLNF